MVWFACEWVWGLMNRQEAFITHTSSLKDWVHIAFRALLTEAKGDKQFRPAVLKTVNLPLRWRCTRNHITNFADVCTRNLWPQQDRLRKLLSANFFVPAKIRKLPPHVVLNQSCWRDKNFKDFVCWMGVFHVSRLMLLRVVCTRVWCALCNAQNEQIFPEKYLILTHF